MKIVKYKDAVKFSNSDKCIGLEYPMDDKDINFSTATITGRYPETGYCTNEVCKELIYVVEGSGTLNKKDEVIEFSKVMPCTPAWYPEQHKLVD